MLKSLKIFSKRLQWLDKCFNFIHDLFHCPTLQCQYVFVSVCVHRFQTMWHERLSCHSNMKHKCWIKVIIRFWQDIRLLWQTKIWQDEKHEADKHTQHPAICQIFQDNINLLLIHPTNQKTGFFKLEAQDIFTSSGKEKNILM